MFIGRIGEKGKMTNLLDEKREKRVI